MTTEEQVKKFLKKYIEQKDNIFFCDRIFMANSVLTWALENIKEKEKFIYYLKEVEKHLSGELTLYWEDGSIKVKRKKR